MEKIVPPMTGAGMQYLRKRGIYPFKNAPRRKTATAAAGV